VEAERRRSMRKILLISAIALVVWARAAHAAPPAVTVEASPTSGAAPLMVTFTASGGAVSYHWQFGDGAEGDGATVEHTYQTAGRFTAVVTGSIFTGGAIGQASVEVTAYALSLKAPSPIRLGRVATFSGALVPAEAHVRIALSRNGKRIAGAWTGQRGAFRLRTHVRAPGTYEASFGGVVSNSRSVRVRPILTARFRGAALVGSPLALVVRVKPASAGRIHVLVRRGNKKVFQGRASGSARIRLKTPGPLVYRVSLRVETVEGYVPVALRLRTTVALPRLSWGARGASVRFLEQRLAQLHYALERADGYYGEDTYDAVLAFQKVNWLERDGVVGPAVWRRLNSATIPLARYRSGTHLEVDKTRQVLFDVRGGKVARVLPVSTGATGNTPVGTFHVYSKEPGYNAKLMYYSMYFLGNFALHGYPTVPSYPASHGCVRIPIWAAVSMYDTHGYGTTVIIYY
jgi:N-acetylmuramoyl-L-alanine amidase